MAIQPTLTYYVRVVGAPGSVGGVSWSIQDLDLRYVNDLIRVLEEERRSRAYIYRVAHESQQDPESFP